LRLVVNASPGRAFTVTFGLDCYRGVAHRRKQFKLPRRTPINRRVDFPIRNPDFCFVDAKASFEDPVDEDGWIVVKLYGRAELTAPLLMQSNPLPTSNRERSTPSRVIRTVATCRSWK
jgi:hypothetical protein